ncbi:DUF2851 family protein [Olivibacter domesticus]|uniref:DUF2851 domain-containing protein n=1 Tax=Olivibacter domesticus TaxID=407022 RepID=A0A1H7WZA7_OLID1|nr:DUF2851 family protein [Olivibacter domesticus]SEM26158.1 Protein of unknown function [Olivibacter domesticus]
MNIPEEVLHYIWKYRLYNTYKLRTKNEKILSVKYPGDKNRHAGPDFEHSRLIIEGIEWAGNVEIHIKSSDWYAHKHQHDPAYNNVILHVVYDHDSEIILEDGTMPETLELKTLIDHTVLNRYNEFMTARTVIPCQEHISLVEPFYISQWLERLSVERLLEKAQYVNNLLNDCQGSWEEITYILLAKNFGYRVNAIPFERLAKSLPYKLLKKYEDGIFIEALMFGQAGMLEKQFKDDYPNELQHTYRYLQKQYHLKPIDAASWRFLRMRPLNFPTIRLAQFSAWHRQAQGLFSKIIEAKKVDELRCLFEDLPINSYWKTHYKFDVLSKKHPAKLGKNTIDSIILNTVVTILFSYGKYIGKEAYICRAVDLLEELAPEHNSIVNQYKRLGVQAKTATDSQALLQLKGSYCDKMRCLTCGIGLHILKQNETL